MLTKIEFLLHLASYEQSPKFNSTSGPFTISLLLNGTFIQLRRVYKFAHNTTKQNAVCLFLR